MSYSHISSIYQIGKIIYGILSNSNISGSNSISVPISISIPYSNSFGSVKNDSGEIKDLDFFQMDKLLTWMKFFFENSDVSDVSDDKDTVKAYKKELYNIYVGIRSDYIQYKNWKKYNNSLWVLSYYRSKNTKDLSKKIISDIQLFNDGLKMFSIIFKDKDKNKNE
jgi:hypothetical protein